MFLIKVCNLLTKKKIPYAIVGGHAVAIHGAVRGTMDVDFVIKWNLENLQKVEKSLNEIDLESRLPISAADLFQFKDEYIRNRNLIAWNFYNPNKPIEQVDIIISHDLSSMKAKSIKTSLGTIKVISKEDLIKMKKESGRPQDLEDIRSLEKLPGV